MRKSIYALILSLSPLSFAQEESTKAFPAATENLEVILVTPGVDKQSAPLVVAPGSYERRRYEDIKEKTPRTLEDALGQTTGVEFTGGPRTQAQIPQIRGLDAGRILILEDGVRQNFQSGHNGRVFGDYSLTETVEIVKGPWSALYGSGAMGGVISFTRSTAADYVRRTEQLGGIEAGFDFASANVSSGQRLTGFLKRGFFEPLVSYRSAKADDVRLGDGTKLDYSGSDSQDLYSSLGFEIDPQQKFTLKLNRFEDEAQVPLNPEQTLGGTNLLGLQTTLKQDVIGDYSIARDRFDAHARPFFRESEIKKKRLSDGRIDTQSVTTTGLDAWVNWHPPLESWRTVVTMGIDYFRDENRGRRGSAKLDSFPDGSNSQLGVYLQPTMKFGKLTLAPGLRHDSYRIEDTSGVSPPNEDQNVTTKSYVTYEYQPQSTVFAGWGQAFNSPRLQDLYANGMHFPGNFFVANPDLKPERSETWETGAKSRFAVGNESALTLNLTYFRTEARDFVERQVDFGAGTTIFANLDKVRLEGYEARALFAQPKWGAALSYAQTRSLDKNSGEPLATTMTDQWLGSLMFFPTDKLTLGTDMRLAEKQDRVPVGVDETPGYFAQDYYVTFKRGPATANLRISNAYDRDYRRHTSAIKDTGRDVRLAVSWVF